MAAPERDDADFWMATPFHRGDDGDFRQSRLVFNAIAGSNPLDRERPLFDQGNVPPIMADLLFLHPSEPGDSGNTAEHDLRTYAVIDGERLQNTAELLEASGLEHVSLFGADADPRMIKSGPWLVRITEESRFTRNFFLPDVDRTSSTALWMKNWGIFLQSDADLEGLTRHLRKFTRIRDEYDSWFYFRFWDADFMGLYLRQAEAAEMPLVRRLLDPAIIDSLILTSPFDGCYTVRFDEGEAGSAMPEIRFRRPDFDAVAEELADRRAARVFDQNYHRLLQGEGLAPLRDRISVARAACTEHGISEDGFPGTFILLGVVFARDFWKEEAFRAFWSGSRLSPTERFQLYLSGLKSAMKRANLPLKPWWR